MTLPVAPPELSLSRAPAVRVAGGKWVALGARESVLLAWLALEGPTPRVRLAQLLWPDSEPDAARNALRQRLFQLRRLSGAELVAGTHTLSLADGVTHDLLDADTVLGDNAHEVGAALSEWLAQQRGHRRGRLRMSLIELCDLAMQAGDPADALSHANELLVLEPLSEEAHRRVIRLHYLAGDRSAALLAFDRLEQVLKHEVGTRPSEESLVLLRSIEGTGPQLSTELAANSREVPAGVLRPSRLVGRAQELAAMQQGWEASQVVALIGEAGMGKSRLLQAFAHEHGGIVGASARPGDAGVPFSTLARLLRAVASGDTSTDLTPSTRGELAIVLPEWGEPAAVPGVEVQRLKLIRAVRELLARQPHRAGVFVDDLHFADNATIDVLRSLMDDAAEPDGADALAAPRWVLAYRPAEAASPVQGLHDGLVEQARLTPVRLSLLDEAALAELVDSLMLPGVIGSVLAPGLLRRTGGNPLFVLETLKQAWVERSLHQLAETLPRPLSVTRLIQRRLTQLSPPALMLARCAAVAGQEFSPALASQVLGVHALGLSDAWAELELAQVLRGQSFVHDLYHEAALASIPQAIARHLHAQVADCLEVGQGLPVASAILARHWLAAQQPERALPHLERAARAAQEALDPVLAASLFSQLAQARSDTGDAAAAFAAALAAMHALRNHGSGVELGQAIERLSSLAATPRQRATAYEARGVMHHMRGEAGEAAGWVQRGLDELTADDDSSARVSLLNLHGIVLRRAGQLKEARVTLEQALVLARSVRPGEGEVDLPAVLNNLALVLQELDDHLGASGLLQESAGLQTDPLVRARVLNNMGISLEERGQSALAYEQRLAAARLCAASQNPGLAELMLAISLGANARNLARYRDALTHLAHAEQLAASVRHWREEDLHRQYAAVWLELGRASHARQSLEAAEHAAGPGVCQLPAVLLVRARYLIAIGQDARAVLDQAEDALRRAAENRSLRRLLVCKAQVLPPEEAAELMRELIESPALQDNAGAAIPVHVRRAQALLRLGQAPLAVRHAQRAADALGAALPLDLSCAEVWLTLAQALRANGELVPADAAAAAGKRWLNQVVTLHLDDNYRDGYLNRNPVNRELLAWTAQPCNA